MPDDLFTSAVLERLERRAPLAARLRPRSLDEVVGQDQLLGPGKPLRVLIEADRLSSVVLWGPPGTGKTTIARLVAGATEKAFEPLSAVTAGVKDVREIAERARARIGEHGRGTILFLDEVHRFNKTQQDALLPHVEEGLFVLIGATTENPFFSLTGPLLSRSTLFRLEQLGPDDVRKLLLRALADEDRGLGDQHLAIDDDALAHLVDRAEGDARHALTSLEVAAALAAEGGGDTITLEHTEAALALRALRYGDDEHYDVLSAFIKSIRGSDVDAGLYWLARMVEAGEDPRLIARRLVILASEDVGMADPQGLVVADAAARAVEFVGMPEAQLNLAHAVVYLASAPKSNSAATALWAAQADVRDQPAGAVPRHLRDASYPGAAKLGHGKGYEYPHDAPEGWVEQQYRPDGHAERYWNPTGHGADVDRRPGYFAGHVEEEGGRMSGEEWVAIVGAQICLVALVVLVVMIVRLDRATTEIRRAARDFRSESEPLLQELRDTVRAADYELDRIDAIVSGAETVTDRVDAASDLAYRTFTSPVVKALAVGTGTKRAVQRLKGDPPKRRSPDKRGREAS